MQGTKDSKIRKQNSSWVKIVARRCNNKTRLEEEPVCEDDLVIDKWLSKKKLMLRAINMNVDLKIFD